MVSTKNTSLKIFFSSRLFLIILLIISVMIAINFMRAYYQDYKIREEIKSLEEEVKNLEQKKIESMKILKYVSSDEFVEDAARKELNLQKPGEKVVFIKDNNDLQTSTGDDNKEDLNGLGNPIKWWYYLTGKNIIFNQQNL